MKNYTQKNETSIYTQSIPYLQTPSNFRPFHEGLTELLQRSSHKTDFTSPEAQAGYLFDRLKAIGSNIEKSTVLSWFSGDHRPKIEPGSRSRMYEICFALQLSMEHIRWFFHHVYYDRCFNCHLMPEAVYYYCLKNCLPYCHAKALIAAVKAPETPSVPETAPSYTHLIQTRLDAITSDQELLDFLASGQEMFTHWNISASAELNRLLQKITGSEASLTLLRRMKQQSLFPADQIRACGLIFRELYLDAKNATEDTPSSIAQYMLESLSGRNPASISFLLDVILNTPNGLPKQTPVPYIVKNNFPGKKVFSEILDPKKSGVSKSYDSFRKALVLLKFYDFWCREKLGDFAPAHLTWQQLAEVYRDETDALLLQCCYEPMFAGNPYDWLFLHASLSGEPLDYFRSVMDELLDVPLP